MSLTSTHTPTTSHQHLQFSNSAASRYHNGSHKAEKPQALDRYPEAERWYECGAEKGCGQESRFVLLKMASIPLEVQADAPLHAPAPLPIGHGSCCDGDVQTILDILITLKTMTASSCTSLTDQYHSKASRRGCQTSPGSNSEAGRSLGPLPSLFVG